jgi:hypothetical protein
MIWYLTGTGPGPQAYDAVEWLLYDSVAEAEAWTEPSRREGVRPEHEGWPELKVTTQDERTFHAALHTLQSGWSDVTWTWDLIDGRPPPEAS